MIEESEERVEHLLENFELLASTLEAVRRLEEKILEWAVRGKLGTQDAGDEPASELIRRIFKAEKGFQYNNIRNVPYNIPPSWVWVNLNHLFSPLSVKGKQIATKDYLETGSYPIVSQGKDLISGFSNDKDKVIHLSNQSNVL